MTSDLSGCADGSSGEQRVWALLGGVGGACWTVTRTPRYGKRVVPSKQPGRAATPGASSPRRITGSSTRPNTTSGNRPSNRLALSTKPRDRHDRLVEPAPIHPGRVAGCAHDSHVAGPGWSGMSLAGSTPAAFEAYHAVRGIRTLALRLERACRCQPVTPAADDLEERRSERSTRLHVTRVQASASIRSTRPNVAHGASPASGSYAGRRLTTRNRRSVSCSASIATVDAGERRRRRFRTTMTAGAAVRLRGAPVRGRLGQGRVDHIACLRNLAPRPGGCRPRSVAAFGTRWLRRAPCGDRRSRAPPPLPARPLPGVLRARRSAVGGPAMWAATRRGRRAASRRRGR